MPIELTVNQGEQDVLLKISPTTQKGNPATVEPGSTEYIIESGEGSINEAEDELSAVLVTGGVGDVSGHIKADADLGEGVKEIRETFLVHVVSPQAENLGATGEAIDKVPA